MNCHRLETLLWERIDGTINGQAREELEAALAADPEARRLESEIARMVGQLETMPRLVPEHGLRSRIASAVAAARAPGPPTATRATSIHRHHWIRSQTAWLPLAACLVIGIAIGLMIAPIGGVNVEESKAAGAMGAEAGRPGPTLHLALDRGLGSLIVTRAGTGVTIELRLETDDELTLSVGQPGAEVAVRELGDDRPDRSLTVIEGRAVLRTRGPGASRLGIIAGSESAPLHIEVWANGENLVERWVE